MPRPRPNIGEHGDVHTWQRQDGRWQARVQVRDADGRLRQVACLGPSKGAARRALQRRLDLRRDPSVDGVHVDMTVSDLAAYWLAHRAAHGKSRGQGEPAPQTLAAYDDAITYVIAPALGGVRLNDVKVSLLDAALARIESGADGETSRDRQPGRSTAQARTVLKQMFDLAVRHGAMLANPMSIVEPTSRGPRLGLEVDHLTVPEVLRLRHLVRREVTRTPGRRMPNLDLQEWTDFVVGTGCRDGEALATRWCDLDLGSDTPTVHVCGTVIEPRGSYVTHLHRQATTKSRSDRTLILPDHVATLLQARARRSSRARPEAPVFATAVGNWISDGATSHPTSGRRSTSSSDRCRPLIR
jgi:integrase